MDGLTLAQLAEEISGRLVGAHDARVQGVSTDTRSLQRDALFVALEGDRFDGHNFVVDALHAGACGVVMREDHPAAHADYAEPFPVLLVADTLRAYGDIARAHARRLRARRVGITGSVGKTTTRGMLAAVLGRRGVCESLANHNNLVGVPQTLLRATPEDGYLIVEMGADRPGEIQRLAEIVEPQVAVITAIGPVHLERFGSEERVAIEKSAIYQGLIGEDAVSVVPAGGPHEEYLLRRARGRVLRFGRTSDADVWGEGRQLDENGMPRFVLHAGDEMGVCYLNTSGASAVDNALAAACVAYAEGLTVAETIDGLESYSTMEGRGRLHRLPRRNAVLIDSAYNASPPSMASAIETLEALAARRRIAVLGDMLELGTESERRHRELGERVAKSKIDILICTGALVAATAREARAQGQREVHEAADCEEAAALLDDLIEEGDAILVKGSHAIGLERVVRHLRGDEGAVGVME